MRFLISIIFLLSLPIISLAEDKPLSRSDFSFSELNRLNFNFANGHQTFKPIETPKSVEPIKIIPKIESIVNDPTKPTWIVEKGGEDRLRKENGLWKQKCWDGTGEWIYSPSTNSWIKESYQPVQYILPGNNCPNGQCPLPNTNERKYR